MAGTKAGGLAAAKTIKLKHGEDFYKRAGSIGGKQKTSNTHRRGFGSNKELAASAGKKGGRISRRFNKPKQGKD